MDVLVVFNESDYNGRAYQRVNAPLFCCIEVYCTDETENSPRPTSVTGLGGIHTIYRVSAPLRTECEQPFIRRFHPGIVDSPVPPFRTLDPALVNMMDVYRVANDSVSVILIRRHFTPSCTYM